MAWLSFASVAARMTKARNPPRVKLIISTHMGGVFFVTLLLFSWCLYFGWGTGIEGRLTRERDSEAKAVKTGEKSWEIMEHDRKLKTCK